MEVLHKELSYELVGCFYNTRNKYGMHHPERVYHRALPEELNLKKIGYIYKPKIAIYSMTTGKILTYFEPDLLIDKKIIVELKAMPFTKKEHIMQTFEYLKTSTYELAYLVNFGEQKFKPIRFIHTKDRKSFIDNTRK